MSAASHCIKMTSASGISLWHKCLSRSLSYLTNRKLNVNVKSESICTGHRITRHCLKDNSSYDNGNCLRLFSQSTKKLSIAEIEDVIPSKKDLRTEACDIFRFAVSSVRPRQMIENVLKYDAASSELKVEDKTYKLNRNVFVVGFGKAVLGMARVVEDIIGAHIVNGIVSIPEGFQEEVKGSRYSDLHLSPDSQFQVYEGADNNEADESSYNAAKAIQSLVSRVSEGDLLVVLCSGGGSALCPSPAPPITLSELRSVTRLLARGGATIRDLNTVRKNLEILKGGGLAMLAKPAKVVTLILSSIVGDPVDLIACGPTHPSHPTPHHCFEIFQRLDISEKVPGNVKKFLEREVKQMTMTLNQKTDSMVANQEMETVWDGLQNVVVGNNSIACEAAASRAEELGYFPLILTTLLIGEARKVGALHVKLAKFIMFCFDRKASLEPSAELALLELELVSSGIRKELINFIGQQVEQAYSLNKDICVILSGEFVVHIVGSGMGGKNQEAALGAAIAIKEELLQDDQNTVKTQMCFLSADTDGHDGVTKMAGAVVDQNFVQRVEFLGLDMQEYLDNNDSYTFFKAVDSGANLVKTKHTGTNVMDMMIILVKKPEN